MKTKLSAWYILFILFLLGSCGKTDEPANTPANSTKISVDIDAGKETPLTAQAVGETIELSISSLSPWTMAITDTRTTTNWLTASVYLGSSVAKITLQATENMDKTSRTAYILLENATASSTLVFTQQPYGPANLALSTTNIEVESAAVSKTFTLHSDISWKLQSDNESYCTASPVQGKAGEFQIRLSIPENTSTSESRTSHITINAGYETAVVIVIQKRKNPELNIDKGIKSLDDLCNFRDAVNSNNDLSAWKYNGEINLLNDIDLSYVDNWVPIGISDKQSFAGIFNGNGFTIKNLKIYSANYYLGLFGRCTGIIKNLNLTNVDIARSNPSNVNTGGAAAFCGCLETEKNGDAKIINCSVAGYVDTVDGSICCCYTSDANVYVTDCTNKAITTGEVIGCRGSSGDGKIILTSCTNEGATSMAFPGSESLFTDNGGNIDNGYVAPISDIIKQTGIKPHTIDEFIASVKQIKTFKFSHISPIPYNTKFLSILDHAETVEINYDINDEIFDLSYFKSLKNLKIDDVFRNSRLFKLDCNTLPNLEALDCNIYYLQYLTVDKCKNLAKLTLHTSMLAKLDISKTNIGNSTESHPLNIPYGPRLEILYLKTGWEINGININRNDEYIPKNTSIFYKD